MGKWSRQEKRGKLWWGRQRHEWVNNTPKTILSSLRPYTPTDHTHWQVFLPEKKNQQIVIFWIGNMSVRMFSAYTSLVSSFSWPHWTEKFYYGNEFSTKGEKVSTIHKSSEELLWGLIFCIFIPKLHFIQETTFYTMIFLSFLLLLIVSNRFEAYWVDRIEWTMK